MILPGGFAHGDYLRTGAIARFSPIMSAVSRFAERGGPVLGICNGFQILLEAGLLPGAMVRNDSVKFVSRHVDVRVEHTDTPFTVACEHGQVLRLPIAHGEGNYFADPDALRELEANRQVIFRYRRATPERFGQRHCRHLQHRAQRRRADAASGAGLRGMRGQRGRSGRPAVGGEGVR